MPKSGCSEREVEVGSGLAGVLPVSSSIDASLCADIVWCSDRMSETLSSSPAWSGKSSHTSRPGTLVAIGRNGPRYSVGASGLRSYVSSWLGPPHIQKRMTEASLEG